jgi:hypothetical protein
MEKGENSARHPKPTFSRAFGASCSSGDERHTNTHERNLNDWLCPCLLYGQHWDTLHWDSVVDFAFGGGREHSKPILCGLASGWEKWSHRGIHWVLF